jgi:integrase
MLIGELPAQYQPLVTVLAQTGLRIGEASGLRWKRVNLTDEYVVVDGEAIAPNSILIAENYVRGEYTTLKTASSRRKIPLTATAWVAFMTVREMSQWTGDEHPVFAARNGSPLDGHNVAKRYLKPAAKVIGAPWVSWHCFRHTAATATDQFLTSAQKTALLGHTSSAMSARYTHPQIEAMRIALEKAEDDGRVN